MVILKIEMYILIQYLTFKSRQNGIKQKCSVWKVWCPLRYHVNEQRKQKNDIFKF